jgi:iron complex outermembrane receptor protein
MQKPFSLAAMLPLTFAASDAAFADADEPDEHHQLEEIIVTATPLPRTVESLAQPTSVLSGDALIRKQNASIGETLGNELGVNSTYFGPVASRPVIRGQYGERVEMLNNGISALDASALSEDHAVALDSILADRVEIIRGPATLLYGSGAAGGIVNVVDSRIHETPLAEPISGAISLGMDSAIGKQTGAFKVDAGNENIAFHLDYMNRTTDNIEIPGFAESATLRALEEAEGGEEEEGEEEAFGTVENTDSETDAGAAAVTLTNDRGFIGLSVSAYNTNYGLPGAHEHAHEGEEGGTEEEEEEEEIIRIDMEQTRYDLRAGYELSGFVENVSFRAALNDYEHVELEGPEVGTRYDNSGIDSRIELQHAAIGNLVGAFGIQYKELDFDAVGEEAFVPPSVTEQLGFFVFEEWTATDSLVFQGSARLEQQDIDTPDQQGYSGSAFGASAGALWSWSDNSTLSANFSVTERHPNATELYANGPHLAVQRFERGSVTLGNGVLDKETSQNLDVSLRGNYAGIEFSLNGFFNDVSDYILLNPTSEEEDGLQVFDFTQTDAELYGFEAEALVDVYRNEDRHAHVRVFSDLTRGKFASGGNLPRMSPLRYGVSLHYRAGGLDTSIRVARTEEQDRVAEFELPTAAYTMIDAEVSYRVEAQGLLVFLRGTNLGDEDARRHTSPLKDLIPLPGRSLVAGLRWDF